MLDIFSHLATGFAVSLSLENLLYCFIGTVAGTAIGVLPGVGPLATMAMLLPITFSLSPTASLIMLAGIYYGSQYGGSTTAILLNLPGEASSAVTTIDGYQMARQGRAGEALAAAALGSFFAGTVATIFVALFAVPLTGLALQFGPPEYTSLIVLGLIASVVLARGSVVKALCMVILGVLLGLVGLDNNTGTPRFSLGFIELAEGINLVAFAVGVFGITEILRNLEHEMTRSVLVTKVTGLWAIFKELPTIIMPVLRGTLLGSFLGVLPGGGGLMAAFASYSLEKKISRNSAQFGHGAIEGVAAPESANNAAAQTSFIPMLTLGIPSNGIMALMAGAMILQGIVPGPNVIRDQPGLFWGLITSMWVGNLMLVLLNLPLVGIWVRLLRIPYYALFPAIIVFSAIGVYSTENSGFVVYQITIFGLFGYLMSKLDCEPTPMVLGFVLGPMLETYLRRSMLMSRGDPLIFLTQPISLAFLIIAVIALVIVCWPKAAKKRAEVFAEE